MRVSDHRLAFHLRIETALDRRLNFGIRRAGRFVEQRNRCVLEFARAIALRAWSFTDILSWLNGYQKRYGFVYVDRDERDARQLRRVRKDSFHWFRRVIASNARSL